ncbi:glycoside hydrolase family 16 [Pyrrhoderma noxium]|uniref:Glycoside hydrolase family 16 n=1 Tax=Pyrrhoderma noxium TaxID=2282107 RepID=A0A286UG64_9AGAM|nr:glycoside hydrolase family 16 [Pyrrhoderma noxium]
MGLLRSTLLASLLLSLSSSVTAGSADTYHLQDTYIGSGFLSGFNWETFDDPSGGYVNYLDQGTALQRNLTYASGNKFIVRADDTNVVPSGARGRDSIRITSHKAYTDSIIILDLAHMPGGCGQWSAFWSYSPNDWPNGGEVDMIEIATSTQTTTPAAKPTGPQTPSANPSTPTKAAT